MGLKVPQSIVEKLTSRALPAVWALLMCFSCATPSTARTIEHADPLQPVDFVDLQRYLGVWYEIASYPQRFQKDCTATQATYSLRDDGRINVLNECRLGTPEGELKQAQGVAWVVDKKSNAKLKVRFFWPFAGDYWIIELADDYRYAVIGHPDRTYLWILSRTKAMIPADYDYIASRLQDVHGYDLSKLKPTVWE